jgi:D-serine deaminase-like pyridoxal phosphate-dependent protein
LDTPAVVVDWGIVEANLERMAARVSARGHALWPHVKTHKSLRWARRQMELGARGLMVAKLEEAGPLARHGMDALYVGYPLVGPGPARRLEQLVAADIRVRVAVDSLAGVACLAQVAQATRAPITALVEVDTGFHRCGVATVEEAARLADALTTAGVLYQGITCFGGHITWRLSDDERRAAVVAETRQLAQWSDDLRARGWAPEVVSQGGTVPTGYLELLSAATELRPGTYIYNDTATVLAGAAEWADCAAWVWTTVVSTPTSDRAVVDAGSKTLAGDGPVAGSFGHLRERPDLVVASLSEEHGVIRARDGGRTGLQVGDRLSVVPNHVCTMINLHDAVHLVEGRRVVGSLAVDLRGAVH